MFLDATTIVVNILEKLTKTLSNLIVNKKRMLENVKMTKDVIFSQTLLLNLIKSNDLSRKENYEKVQTLAFKAFNENVPLWNERDISHSSNERVVFLDATTIVVNISLTKYSKNKYCINYYSLKDSSSIHSNMSWIWAIFFCTIIHQ